MSIQFQIEIPNSFKDLYNYAGSQNRYAPRNLVVNRYKLCDEMAQDLEELATFMYSNMGMTKADVLVRCQRGLGNGGGILTEGESKWVISYLEERWS